MGYLERVDLIMRAYFAAQIRAFAICMLGMMDDLWERDWGEVILENRDITAVLS